MLTLLLSLSCSGSIVIIIAVLFCHIYRKKLSLKWQYYIWIAAIARLLLPFGPTESLSGNLASQIQASWHAAFDTAVSPIPSASMTDDIGEEQSDTTDNGKNPGTVKNTAADKASDMDKSSDFDQTKKAPDMDKSTDFDQTNQIRETAGTNGMNAAGKNTVTDEMDAPMKQADMDGIDGMGGLDGMDSTDGINDDADGTNSMGGAENSTGIVTSVGSILKAVWTGRKYICVFWLLTAALLFIRKITIYQDFVRFVRAGSTPVDSIDSLEALSKLENLLGMNKAVDLLECPLIASPILIGFAHPSIVLPKVPLSEQQLHDTMLHELIHYKRRDMYYKWTAQLAICIHWFNPLAYCMGRMVNRLCELSCDEAAVSHFQSADQRREYAQTLLDAMSAGHNYQEPLASLTLSGNKNLLKERLESIMNPIEKTIPKRILTAVLTAAITITSFYTGSSLTNASPHPQPAGNTGTSIAEQHTGSDERNINNISQNANTYTPDDTHTLANTRSSDDEITPAQADEMALALTHQIWVWDWIAFFVPYMSDEGVKQLLPASKNSEWAGSKDMTTGKKLKFTKKQINTARKYEPSQALTRRDIDSHALLIMQSNGDWDCTSCMLPYMTRKGIRAVTRCYNKKHGGEKKRAEDYY